MKKLKILLTLIDFKVIIKNNIKNGNLKFLFKNNSNLKKKEKIIIYNNLIIKKDLFF